MRIATIVLAMVHVMSASSDVTVLPMDDTSGFAADAPIEELSIEEHDARTGLHMRLPCEGTGVSAVRYVFGEAQDWTGYDTLRWDLFASTTAERTHIQVQLFDTSNRQVMMRRDLAPSHLDRWRPMRWSFRDTQPQDAAVDFSQVKMIFFSAWKDHYGHEAGVTTDYWIGPVERQRSWEPATLAVAPTSTAPEIDGRMDDHAWSTTPAAQQFFLRRGEGLPVETSELRVLWDDTNLYIGLRNDAQVLDPVLQRTNEFVANATEHGSAVFRDDSIELFIDPLDPDLEYMQFATNALGTRYEGRGTDASWEGAWEAAGFVSDEGYWETEIAIPWSTLGVVPAAGIQLGANVCRNNRAMDESTMWSPMTFSFHAPDEFGRFVLLGEPPAVVVESGTIPPLMMGSNTITPSISGPGSVQFRARITQEGSPQAYEMTAQGSDGRQSHPVDLSVQVTEAGEVSLVYSALDAATDALYYQSPEFTFATAAVAPVGVSADTACEVFLNGQPLGTGGRESLVGYLRPGPNVIAVVADEPVAVEVTSGEMHLTGSEGWRQSAAPEAGWMEPGFDPAEWTAASGERLNPAAGGQHFRRVIAADTTRLRSLGEVGNVHIVAGGAQHLPMLVVSPLERALADARLIVEVPPGLELLPWDNKRPYEWTGTWSGYSAEPITREGDQWVRHTFAWDELQPLEYRGSAHESYQNERIHTLGMVLRAGEVEPGIKTVRAWVEAADGSVVEVPREMPLTVLPALPARRPAEIEIQMCHGFSAGNYDGDDMRALISTMADAGFNSYIERTTHRDVYFPILRDLGMKIVLETLHHAWYSGIDVEGNEYVSFDGGRSSYHFACPQWLVGEGRETVVAKLAEHLSTSEILPDAVWWDMEFGPRSACFDDRCLERFAQEYEIEGELTPEIVMEQHHDEWVDFWVHMWARIGEVYRDAVVAANPDGEFHVYSGYQTPRARELYCIDWSVMGQVADVASAGYGWNSQIIDDTVEALDGTPLLAGVAYYQPPRNMNLKVEYLRLLMSGASGIMHYQWTPLDGLDYARISGALSLVADHEALILRGERADGLVSGVPHGVLHTRRSEDTLLAVIVNPGSAPQNYTVELSAAGTVTEYYSGQRWEAGRPMEITVPPHDAVALTAGMN